jgi:hypothetical protein
MRQDSISRQTVETFTLKSAATALGGKNDTNLTLVLGTFVKHVVFITGEKP